MDDINRAILRSWEFRPIISFVCLAFGVLYTVGWWRLRQLREGSNRPHLAKVWRLVSYWLGLIILLATLISPIDLLGGQLFTMHMIQHIMLGMFAPPLLMIANPQPVIMWALPLEVRRTIGRLLFSRTSPIRPALTAATKPAIIWIVFVIFLWGWHDGRMYSWALRDGLVHDVEHFTFFYSALLLWWHTTGAGPRFHKRMNHLQRAAFAFAGIPPNMIAGVIISLADTPIYTYYLSVPRLWNLSVMQDQRLGGVIMWVPGSMMYLLAGLITIGAWFVIEERRANERRAIHATAAVERAKAQAEE